MKIYRAPDRTWVCEFMCVGQNGAPYKRTITGDSKREVKRRAKEEINANRTEALERRKRQLKQQNSSESHSGQTDDGCVDDFIGCALEGCGQTLIEIIFGGW